MRKFTFTKEVLSSEPGWEASLYTSEDISGSWMFERSCMEDVILSEVGVSLSIMTMLSDYDLDRILIENDIYCEFVDS